VKHSLGHGLGLDIHELPSITQPRRGKKKKLKPIRKRRWRIIRQLRFQPGMVFTIEPGVYAKGVGGCRIENDVLMTARGPRVLTHSKLVNSKMVKC
jgi:Xaa-Pro aminopeptidase